MHRDDKERVVAELTERLRTSETLIVADYRGLTNSEIDGLRTKLLEHGARFAVVKNTLTRRAAEAAGADALLALLEGPSAIAFVESEGDPAAVAKALRDAATSTKVLAIRGGILQGSAMSAEQVENLAMLPPAEVLRAQLVGAIVSPLTTVVALISAPLRDLVGLIDARIEQLREQGDTSDSGAAAPESTAAEPEPEAEAPAEEPTAEAAPETASAEAEPAAEDVAAQEGLEVDEQEGGDAEPVVDEAAAPEETTEETTDTQEEQE